MGPNWSRLKNQTIRDWWARCMQIWDYLGIDIIRNADDIHQVDAIMPDV